MGLLTQYRYDELGRLIEVEDANNNITRYEYDKAGRRTVVELPLNQRSSSTYDAAGNLKTYTDFNQEVTAFDYDAMGRLIEKDYEDNADVSYSYTADGQIHTITDGRGVTEFGYDAQGRLIWRNDPDGATTANGHTIEYEYDTAGNRTAVITPNGRVSYTYDEQNRLETVTDPDGGTSTYTYDDNGNLIQTEFPNGVIETREYDELNRLIGLENKLGDEVISGYRYDLNKAGHRLSVTEADNRQVSYTYDDLYRLTEENINNGERVISYTYDNVGNRLTRTDSVEGTTSYTYDDNDHLLTETLVKDGETIHAINYTYDDNGNLISRTQVTDGVSQTTTYTWNDDDRLVAVQTPDGTVITYEYDDEGIRVSSTVDGQKTEYLIDKNQPYAQVLEEFKSGDLEAFYVYGHDLISQTRNGEQDVYHVDGLGSTRTLTDEEGNVTDTYDYDAFGELIDSEGNSENSYLFAGEQFDKDLEDYYLRQRFYDPGSGRFLRRDTYEGRLNEPITLHKYLYANANPVYYTDPTGLFSLAEVSQSISVIGALAAIGGVAGIMTQGEPLPPLGGFGDGPQPDLPRDTAHRNLIAKILDFSRPRGFGDGPQLNIPNHTGHPPDYSLHSLIRYVFASSYDPQEIAYEIGHGHAWDKDGRNFEWQQLGINSERDLSERIFDIITGSYKKIKVRGNATIYLGFDGTIVIDNPQDPDGGTAFNPNIQQGDNTASQRRFDQLDGIEQ